MGVCLMIVVGAMLHFGIGMFWYSKLFAELWMKESGMTKKDCQPSSIQFSGAIGVALLISAGIYYLVSGFGATSLTGGATVACLAWLTLVASTHFSGVLWSGRPIKLYLIDVGCLATSMVILGGLFGAIL